MRLPARRADGTGPHAEPPEHVQLSHHVPHRSHSFQCLRKYGSAVVENAAAQRMGCGGLTVVFQGNDIRRTLRSRASHRRALELLASADPGARSY